LPNGITLRQAFQLWRESRKAVTTPGGMPPMMSAMLSGQPHWSNWTTKRAVNDGYSANSWVYACVRKLSAAAASIPWYVEKRGPKGDWARQDGHPIEVLLRSPNAHMSGQDLFETLSTQLNLAGNSVWYLNLVRGSPLEIWPMPPDRVAPVPSKDNWIDHYEYRAEGVEKPIPYDPQQIMHFMYINPDDPYWGIAPLHAAAKVVDSDVEAVKWNKIALQNRAITDGVFSFTDPLTEDQYDEARRQVREQYQGAQNAHTPWVLGGGGKWNPMARTPVEMDFIEGRRMNREEIAAVFQVPPVLIGILDHASYANYEQAEKSFWQDTMVSHLRDISAALNLGLVPFFDPKAALRARGQLVEPDLRIRPDFSQVAVLQDDLNGLVTTAKILYDMGVPFDQINQRLELGFESFEGSDEPWRPATYLPNGQLPTSAQVAVAASVPPAKRIGGAAQTKALNLQTTEQKKAHWESFEAQREGWYGAMAEKVKARFAGEHAVVSKAIKSASSPTDAIMSAQSAVTSQRSDWGKLLAQVYAVVAQDFGESTERQLKSDTGPSQRKDNQPTDGTAGTPTTGEVVAYDVFNQAIQDWISNQAATKVTQITDTTRKQLRDELAKGVQVGESIPQLMARIDQLYLKDIIPNRSETIARTEVIAASNLGSVTAAKATGLTGLKKIWLATMDNRTREAHALADGQEVTMADSFVVGGEKLEFPGDISEGATADEIINCRCTVIYRRDGGA